MDDLLTRLSTDKISLADAFEQYSRGDLAHHLASVSEIARDNAQVPREGTILTGTVACYSLVAGGVEVRISSKKRVLDNLFKGFEIDISEQSGIWILSERSMRAYERAMQSVSGN